MKMMYDPADGSHETAMVRIEGDIAAFVPRVVYDVAENVVEALTHKETGNRNFRLVEDAKPEPMVVAPAPAPEPEQTTALAIPDDFYH